MFCFFLSLGLVLLSFPLKWGNFFWLVWFGFVPLLWFLEGRRRKAGWLFLYFALFFVALLWLPPRVLTHVKSGWEWGKLFLTYLIMVTEYALTFIAALSLARSLPVVLSVVVLPAMIVALEYFLTIVPAGFPLYFGLTQQSNVFAIQSAVVFGPAIVSFLLFLSNSMLYQSLRLWFACRRRAVFLSGVLLVLLAVNLCFGVWHFKTRSLLKGEDKDFLKNSARLHLVQPNLDFKAGMYSAQVDFFYNLGLHRLIFLSREPGGSELLVWPELPLLRCMMQEEEPAFRQFIKTLRTPLLLGCPYADYHSGGVQNAAVVLSELGLVRDKYAKVNLFPKFEGENYLAGKEVRTVFVSDKMPRVGAMLCFEVLLPQVSRTLVRQGAQFLVCLSNDTWFEDTAWPRLHMAYMIFRAVENGCYALFMSNNGPSVLVSPAGQIITRLPYFEMANAEVTVGLVPSPTLYRRFGDWFAKLCLAFLFFIAGLQLSRRLYFGWAGAQHFGRRKG